MCAVFRQEVSLLNEADVNVVIFESEFCRGPSAFHPGSVVSVDIGGLLVPKRLVRGWAGAAAAVARYRGHSQWPALVTVLAA